MLKTRHYACIALLGALGCSSEQASNTTPILMGATFSKTGVSAVTTWESSFDLAADDASQGLASAGYPTGKRLSFTTVVADTKNDVTVTTAKGIEMVQQQGAKLVMNGTSSDTVALGKLAYDTDTTNDLNVPIVCVACSSPALHNPNATNADPAVQGADRNSDKWIFGLAMSSAPQSRVLWSIIRQEMTPATTALKGDVNGDGVVKISTIALDDTFGTGFQDAMQAIVLADNPNVIYEKLKHPKDADVNSYDWSQSIAQLIDDQTDGVTDVKPDVVIEFTFPQFSLALVKAYTGSIPFLHTHSMRERTVIFAAANRLDGQDGTSYLPSDGESGQIFDQHFLGVYPSGRQSQWDSDVYDGAFLFALGTVKATKDMADPSAVTGAQIRDAMLTLNDQNGQIVRPGPDEFAKAAKILATGGAINYEGASGPVDFDAYGRAKNKISHWRVNNGQDADVAVYDCIEDDSCPKQ